ncbi:hypothetical protein DS67_07785 [Mesotoga sp. SC_4PWA21]|nr:hypothetical protein DS67_07785 [Mesotoga sp. SC_4PWA21]
MKPVCNHALIKAFQSTRRAPIAVMSLDLTDDCSERDAPPSPVRCSPPKYNGAKVFLHPCIEEDKKF